MPTLILRIGLPKKAYGDVLSALEVKDRPLEIDALRWIDGGGGVLDAGNLGRVVTLLAQAKSSKRTSSTVVLSAAPRSGNPEVLTRAEAGYLVALRLNGGTHLAPKQYLELPWYRPRPHKKTSVNHPMRSNEVKALRAQKKTLKEIIQRLCLVTDLAADGMMTAGDKELFKIRLCAAHDLEKLFEDDGQTGALEQHAAILRRLREHHLTVFNQNTYPISQIQCLRIESESPKPDPVTLDRLVDSRKGPVHWAITGPREELTGLIYAYISKRLVNDPQFIPLYVNLAQYANDRNERAHKLPEHVTYRTLQEADDNQLQLAATALRKAAEESDRVCIFLDGFGERAAQLLDDDNYGLALQRQFSLCPICVLAPFGTLAWSGFSQAAFAAPETAFPKSIKSLGQTILRRKSGAIRARYTSRIPKTSISRLPSANPIFEGRIEELAELQSAWENQEVNLFEVVAAGGVGKSALVANWRLTMARAHWQGAAAVYGYSFHSQGTRDEAVGPGDFLEDALEFFGDPDPTRGSVGDRGRRVATLVKKQRTLLILDGLEPHQRASDGHIKDTAIRALVEELLYANPGLCVITSRVKNRSLEAGQELYDWIDLQNLSATSGAALLSSLGVDGTELQRKHVVKQFAGNALALSLLGSLLRDEYGGDHRSWKKVSLLNPDDDQGGQALRVVRSYEKAYEGKPELELIRLMGLFDRPASPEALVALRERVTSSDLAPLLKHGGQRLWDQTVRTLRRARLLFPPSAQVNELDAHPIIREHYRKQLMNEFNDLWKAGHAALYEHFLEATPTHPTKPEEMETAYQALAHGCLADLEAKVFAELYRPIIMRQDELFAYREFGQAQQLLAAIAHFFIDHEFSDTKPAFGEVERVYLSLHAALLLASCRGFAADEVREAYARALKRGQKAKRVADCFRAGCGLWRFEQVAANYDKAYEHAKNLQEIAKDQNEETMQLEAAWALGGTLFYRAEFSAALQTLREGIRDGGYKKRTVVLSGFDPRIACRSYESWALWYLGEFEAALKSSERAELDARELGDYETLAFALYVRSRLLQYYAQSKLSMECAREVLDISQEQGFAHWNACGSVVLGIGEIMTGRPDEGLRRLQGGLDDWLSLGAQMARSGFHGLLAEGCLIANKIEQGLAAVNEGLAAVEQQRELYFWAELLRLKGELQARSEGDEGNARDTLLKARSLASDQGALAFQLRCALSLRLNTTKEDEESDSLRLRELINKLGRQACLLTCPGLEEWL